jgi:pimeloyl-ACP methyl ester carboxylesterase
MLAMIPAVGGIAKWLYTEKRGVREVLLPALHGMHQGTHLAGGRPKRPRHVGRGLVPEEILKDKGRYDLLGKATAKEIPNCRLVEIPNVGHFPHLEAAERFHQVLLDFLAK